MYPRADEREQESTKKALRGTVAHIQSEFENGQHTSCIPLVKCELLANYWSSKGSQQVANLIPPDYHDNS